MATGTDSFMGKAMPILGNATLTGETAADDILTITGATSQSGDYFVIENSTGTEYFVIDSSGYIASEMTFSESINAAAMSDSKSNAITIAVTNTAALTAANVAADITNAIIIQPASNAIMKSVVMYDNDVSAGQASTCEAFLAVNGSTPPDYFMQLWGSAMGLGAAADQGFLDASMACNALATKANWAGLKCLFGSKVYYVMALPDTNLS